MQTQTEPLEIVEAPLRHVVGMARDFSMQTRTEIPGLWQAFFASGTTVPNAIQGAMYGVSFNADGKGNFRYGVAVEVPDKPESIPDGMCCMHLSEGPYAVLRAFGPMQDLPVQFDRMFNDWLPGPDWAIREGAWFERYPDDARNSPEAMAYEIWAPVQPVA